MAERTNYLLVDSNGQPASERIQEVFQSLLPRFRSHFPAIQDGTHVARLFETAARSVARHEARKGTAERLRGLAWTALKRQALSFVRTKSFQAELRTLGTLEGLEHLARATTQDFSPEHIERHVLYRQILNSLSERDKLMLVLSEAGHSAREIAQKFGEPTNTVATRLKRLKVEIRKSLGIKAR